MLLSSSSPSIWEHKRWLNVLFVFHIHRIHPQATQHITLNSKPSARALPILPERKNRPKRSRHQHHQHKMKRIIQRECERKQFESVEQWIELGKHMIHEYEGYSDGAEAVQEAEMRCFKENMIRGDLWYMLHFNKVSTSMPVSNTILMKMQCILTALLPFACTHSRKHNTKQTIH